ncbi:MAG: NAD-dependent epimerase/dehydratase family protein [Spirochaetota bacterium]
MKTNIKVLITGANGFIGSHLLHFLSGRSRYSATGMVRTNSNLFRLKGSCRLVYASITDCLDHITRDVDVVIHTAAKSSDWGPYQQFYRTNVDGTVNLLHSCMKNGVSRFIHLSSTVVYGFNGNHNTIEEDAGRPFTDGYCITKALSEKELLKYRDRIEMLILRPSNVFGPFDTSFTYPLFRAVDRGMKFFPKGGRTVTSPCYVKNLTQAAVDAIHARTGLGEAYNITDGNDLTWNEFLGVIAREMGKNPPRFCLPVKPLYAVSFLLEKLHQLVNSSDRPPLTRYTIAQVAHDYSFSIEKAKKNLGYTPVYTTWEGIKETLEWYYKYKNKTN